MADEETVKIKVENVRIENRKKIYMNYFKKSIKNEIGIYTVKFDIMESSVPLANLSKIRYIKKSDIENKLIIDL
jgi:hypothetical protein